ncbi:ankyrin-1-like [Oppia nitens]|uniref:ankyrin-1-like n=1 Tax=Oppia nitens TaxID=1686743 RepID=UPI0023DC248D|nr:ankyrin-1-like [Oppia nitens]XP_054163157.1 ankyrin-1-like [Oppia nitens]
MPSLPCLQTLQRELADSIIRCAPLDDIRILLACGAKVNEPVTQGLRPLHYATYQKYVEAVNLLLVRGSDVDAMDEVGYTALHLCAERGYSDLMQMLMDHSCRVKFTELQPDDKALGNPPRATLADEPLRLAIKNGHKECAEILLKSGADPNARYFLGSEINLISPLNISFLEMLLKYGACPDSRDRSGLTPLMKACRHPQGYAAAKILLHYGADPNAMTSERHDHRTVLHYAVLSGNIDIVRLLLHHTANVRFPSEFQKPTPLDFAILRGNVEMVKLLINAGADVNVGSPIIGLPLHIALSEKVENKEEIVKILLEADADPNAITVDERGPLLKPPMGEYFNSSETPNCEIIRLLLKYGARIIIKAQIANPIGILKVMHRIHLNISLDIMNLVLEMAESFSIASIKRCSLLSNSQREVILKTAVNPIPLKHTVRMEVRRLLGNYGHIVIEKIDLLPIPALIKKYLLYEI